MRRVLPASRLHLIPHQAAALSNPTSLERAMRFELIPPGANSVSAAQISSA